MEWNSAHWISMPRVRQGFQLPCQHGFAPPMAPTSFAARENMKNHNDDRPYPCQYYWKVFCSLTNRAKHDLNHAVGPKTFICNVCGNGFANKGSLDRHARIHTGEFTLVNIALVHFKARQVWLATLTNHWHPPENRQVIVLQVLVRQGWTFFSWNNTEIRDRKKMPQ